MSSESKLTVGTRGFIMTDYGVVEVEVYSILVTWDAAGQPLVAYGVQALDESGRWYMPEERVYLTQEEAAKTVTHLL